MFLAAAGLYLGSGADGPAHPIPLAGERYLLGADIARYNRFMMSGGPPPDGIPSIDRPQFVSAAQAQLAPGDLVIGFHHEGDLIGGEPPALRVESDGMYELAWERYRADQLPLKSTVSVEAFFFAWNAFYPDSASPSGD